MFKPLSRFRVTLLILIGVIALIKAIIVLLQLIEKQSFASFITISIPIIIFIISIGWISIKIKNIGNHFLDAIEKYLQALLVIYLIGLIYLISIHNPISDLLWYFTAASIFISAGILQYQLQKNA